MGSPPKLRGGDTEEEEGERDGGDGGGGGATFSKRVRREGGRERDLPGLLGAPGMDEGRKGRGEEGEQACEPERGEQCARTACCA